MCTARKGHQHYRRASVVPARSQDNETRSSVGEAWDSDESPLTETRSGCCENRDRQFVFAWLRGQADHEVADAEAVDVAAGQPFLDRALGNFLSVIGDR
jgi:hypothetical protein